MPFSRATREENAHTGFSLLHQYPLNCGHLIKYYHRRNNEEKVKFCEKQKEERLRQKIQQYRDQISNKPCMKVVKATLEDFLDHYAPKDVE